MKKQESKKLQLSKDTLRHLDQTPLGEVIGGQSTTTVLSKWPSCNC